MELVNRKAGKLVIGVAGGFVLIAVIVLEGRAPQNAYITVPNAQIQDPPFMPGSTEPDFNQQRRVVILTYSRSGSSFLGEIFNQNMDAQYWFEPLQAYMSTYKEMNAISEKYHSDFIKMMPTEELNSIGRDGLDSILRCNFSLFSNMSDVRRLFTADRTFLNGIDGEKILKKYDPKYKNMSKDLLAARILPYSGSAKMEKICRRKEIVALKTIRLSMATAEEMLRRDSNLFLIYLTRDPRASAVSRSKLWWKACSSKEIVRKTGEMCRTMLKHYRLFGEISREFKSRTMHVSYENLALHPIENAAIIYRMLGYSRLPPYLEEWIYNNTNATPTSGVGKKALESNFGTARNASAVVNAWKQYKPAEFLTQLGDVCKPIIQALGYQPNI